MNRRTWSPLVSKAEITKAFLESGVFFSRVGGS